MALEDERSPEWHEDRYYHQFDQEYQDSPAATTTADEPPGPSGPNDAGLAEVPAEQLRPQGQGAHHLSPQAPERLHYGTPIGTILVDHTKMHHGTSQKQQLHTALEKAKARTWFQLWQGQDWSGIEQLHQWCLGFHRISSR